MDIKDLPTLEAARDAGLKLSSEPFWKFWEQEDLLRDPDSVEKVGAIRVIARLLVRRVRVTTTSYGQRSLKSLRRKEKEPSLSDGGNSRYVVSLDGEGLVVCAACMMSPGRITCTICAGSGQVQVQQRQGEHSRVVWVNCGGCDGAGTFSCNSCDGTTRSQKVEVALVTDTWESVDYLYLPNFEHSLDEKLREELEAIEVWPESLSVSLAGKLESAGPYRGAAPTDETFKGYVIEEAIEHARAHVQRLSHSGRLLRSEVQAWVMPLVRATHDNAHQLVVYRIPGQAIAALASEPLKT